VDTASVIRAARLRAGFSQAELATRCGTSQATISAYEHGRKVPSVQTLSRLLAATGSRLTVEPAPGEVMQPSRARHAATARSLVDVLALAEALPSRPPRELRYPRLRAPTR
jgi:transcriptional regulator with XRE-family HTH domain